MAFYQRKRKLTEVVFEWSLWRQLDEKTDKGGSRKKLTEKKLTEEDIKCGL